MTAGEITQVDAVDMDPGQGHTFLKTVRSITTMFTHILIGIISGATTLFAFRGGLPLGSTPLHAFLCVIGYQLLMAEAILCLAPDSWLSTLKLRHKRLVHWLLQIGGSVIALAGCFVKIVDKSANNHGHWTTLHGKFALVSMVFTTVSLVNGLTSLYAHELRKFIPGIISKLTHVCFGTVAFVMASVSLCYGFDKNSFKNWATVRLAESVIIMTAIMTTIVIINPLLTLFVKTKGVMKR